MIACFEFDAGWERAAVWLALFVIAAFPLVFWMALLAGKEGGK